MLAVMPNVLLGLSHKCLTTDAGTKVVGLTLIVVFLDSSQAADLHAANWILKVLFVVLMFNYYLFIFKRIKI